MINKKLFSLILLPLFILAGCIDEIPESAAPVRGPIYYNGPEVRKPFDEMPEISERAPGERGYFNILRWLPFEEHFPYDEDSEGDDAGPELPDNLPDSATNVRVAVNLDMENEVLTVADAGPAVPLLVSGNGEVWGSDNLRVYSTNSRNRFKIFMNGWQVRDYTVASVNTGEHDLLSGIGVKVSNQAWYWLERTKNAKISAVEMPLSRNIINDDLRENITNLGLQMETGSTSEGRRGLYLSEIIITQDRDINDNNGFNDNDIVIQNNPGLVIANHPERGGRYQGWGMIINNYLPGNGQLIIRNGDNGVMQWPDGSLYTGNWKDDVRDGRGTFSWPDGKEYTGPWVNGVIEGEGRLTWPDGREYIGSWKNGTMHGKGTLVWYQNGVPAQVYEGNWAEGKADGRGRLRYADGRTYSGTWGEGTANGGGSYTWADGREYSGTFSEGNSDGRGTMSWPDGSHFSGEWRDGLIHGRGRWQDIDGTVIRGRWNEGDYVL